MWYHAHTTRMSRFFRPPPPIRRAIVAGRRVSSYACMASVRRLKLLKIHAPSITGFSLIIRDTVGLKVFRIRSALFNAVQTEDFECLRCCSTTASAVCWCLWPFTNSKNSPNYHKGFSGTSGLLIGSETPSMDHAFARHDPFSSSLWLLVSCRA